MARDATKIDIAKAVEEVFDVKVVKVNTANVKSKPKRVRYQVGRTRTWKKAIVTIEAGQTIEIANYLFYEDADADGNLRTICSIQTTDGDVLATNSSTFIREFGDMVDMFEAMGERVKAIRIVQGVSKGGRTFITCDVVDQ